ncbi:hypothetical protein [Rhizobium sp. RU20A]|uniref:hypothetical protein n=1 Tax=Rhizobium sp. RU20A TaxID=1907412 RepID=UPI00122D3292|nr:hypothetical protein [Rhizobium sp. RU20A]
MSAPVWMSGKERHFRLWRGLVAEMIGAPLDYAYVRRTVSFKPSCDLAEIETLPFLEARVTDPAWKQPSPAERAGIWESLPEEPLEILALLTVPGGIFPVRYAGAIADRLDELDAVIHHAGLGAHTHAHEAARGFFRDLATAEADQRIVASYEPYGAIAVDLLAHPIGLAIDGA